MKFRSVVFLAAVAGLTSLVNYAVWMIAHRNIAWHYRDLVFDGLTSGAFVAFLCLLYCEVSGWIQAQARAIAAIVLLVLTVFRAVGGILSLVLRIYALAHYPTLSSSGLLAQVFQLLEAFAWILFLIAFSSKRVTVMTRLISTVSAVLAVLTLCSAGVTSVQFFKGFAVGPSLASASWNYVLLLFGWGTLILLLAEIRRRWKRDLPIHQNVVAEARL